MKIQNEVKITMLSRSSNESYTRLLVSGFFSQLDPTIEEINDIKTAVSEAVTNSIVHGYKKSIGKIYLELRILENKNIYIKIKDFGVGIDDIDQAMQPLFTTAENEERAGLGFAVMQSFMDKVKVLSKKERGTTIILTKKLKSRNDNE